MTVDDYLLDPDKPDWPSILADWRPLLPYEFSIWLMNRFGDLFVVAADHSVSWVEVAAGTLTLVADNWQDFSRQMDEGTHLESWIHADLVDELVAAGQVLDPGQCYGLRIGLAQGGTYSVANTVVRAIPKHFALLAPRPTSTEALAVDDTPMVIKVDYQPNRPSTIPGPNRPSTSIKVDYGKKS